MTIPGVTSTGSKRPDLLFGTDAGVPLRMTRAAGCTVWDDSGVEYLDLIMGLGAVALGYGHPTVVDAARKALAEGVTGPLPPVLEERVASRLCAVLPGAEAVRFLKTGAEAVAAAIRIARVHTGRDRVITCGYHGWLDWCQAEPGVPSAVKAQRSELPFDDVVALHAALPGRDDVAAIVVEPVIDGAPSVEWLKALKDAAGRIGAVLVFDEIKTAFRLARGGAAERWGVVPDLMVVGKALGNGLPIAAVTGHRDLMGAATRTWISSTAAAEVVGLAAADAVLDVYDREPVIAHLARVGARVLAMFSDLAERYPAVVCGVRGVPEMCYPAFSSADVSSAVVQGAAREGVLVKRTAYNYVSLAHTDEVLAAVTERLERAVAQVSESC